MPEKTLVFIESDFQMMNIETQTKFDLLEGWKQGQKQVQYHSQRISSLHSIRSQEYSNFIMKTQLPNKVLSLTYRICVQIYFLRCQHVLGIISLSSFSFSIFHNFFLFSCQAVIELFGNLFVRGLYVPKNETATGLKIKTLTACYCFRILNELCFCFMQSRHAAILVLCYWCSLVYDSLNTSDGPNYNERVAFPHTLLLAHGLR